MSTRPEAGEPRSAPEPQDAPAPPTVERAGSRLRAPADGPGSVAGLGRRLAGLTIDIVLAALVAGLFTAPELPRNWSLLAWFVLTTIPVALFGATAGMTAVGMRVVRMDGAAFVGVPRAALRAMLVFLVIPAVIRDEDGRALHDRATGTAVLRTR